jgi:hypothetical protein
MMPDHPKEAPFQKVTLRLLRVFPLAVVLQVLV